MGSRIATAPSPRGSEGGFVGAVVRIQPIHRWFIRQGFNRACECIRLREWHANSGNTLCPDHKLQECSRSFQSNGPLTSRRHSSYRAHSSSFAPFLPAKVGIRCKKRGFPSSSTWWCVGGVLYIQCALLRKIEHSAATNFYTTTTICIAWLCSSFSRSAKILQCPLNRSTN